MRTKDFDYHLPDELIASRPLLDRSSSRMLVVNRAAGTIEHRMFTDFPEYMSEDDLLLLNDTKVIPARVFSNDGGIELIVTDRVTDTEWNCMVRPGKKMKVGRTVSVGDAVGEVIEILENGLTNYQVTPEEEGYMHDYYQIIADCYKENGNFEKAHYYFEKYLRSGLKRPPIFC